MFAVIMAGGQGTRFWPKSRRSKPKQLLNIIGDEAMIKKTVDRLIPIIPNENVYAVINASHFNETKEETGLSEENIIVEPVGRNTAPCIGLAALHIERKDPEGVMVVLPSDHFIEDEKTFRETLLGAKEVAFQQDYLVTLGIKPKSPETGFGYIEKGEFLRESGSSKLFKVKRFTEKPDLNTAKAFLDDGNFLWNSGIFIWKASTILDEMKTHIPILYEGLKEIREVMGSEREREVVSSIYTGIEGISIDYGVMEKSSITAVIPSDFGWNDVGSWSSLDELLQKDTNGNIFQGKCLGLETRDTLIHGKDKLIVTLGLDGLVIVDTEDAVLIARKDRCQDVKKIVERLDQEGMEEYL